MQLGLPTAGSSVYIQLLKLTAQHNTYLITIGWCTSHSVPSFSTQTIIMNGMEPSLSGDAN